MLQIVLYVVVAIIFLATGSFLGIWWRSRQFRQKMKVAGESASRIRDEAETQKRELLLEARDEAIKIKTAAELELRDRRAELHRQERRLQQKEELLARRMETLDRRERTVADKERQAEELRE